MMLRAEHLTMRFAGVTALSDVTFAVERGEIHAVCGENGAGKSTLIKLLSGVYRYGSYEGRIEVGGAEARFRSSRDAAAAGISVIHQELTFIGELTVADNIFLGQEPSRWGLWLDRRAAGRRAAQLLARFGVALDPDASMHSLGVGQKQLVEIVKALVRESRILILDEPTAALAAHEVEALLRTLRDLKARGIACIYISHRLEEVVALADRVTILRDGATVCTLDAAAIDEPTIVRHMVGRDIAALHARPAAPHPLRSPRAAPVLLEVRGLDVAHDDGTVRLHDISFELRAGEVLGIGGLMGAGRSELLMHLVGMFGRRTAGAVRLEGRELPAGSPRAAMRSGIALVSEDRRRFGLILPKGVGFNLSLSSLGALSRAGVIRRGAESELNHRWFDSLGIEAKGLSAVVGRLSGGNQQKVVLGKVLMTRPRVILLDEPTRGIDIGAKREVHEVIHRLCTGGCAVLLVSSELPELLGLSDRILMLHQGTASGAFDRGSATPEMLMHAALGS